MFQSFIDTLVGIWNNTGFMQATWQTWVMLLIACVLIYLAIAKQYEPLLLLPIAFGMLLANIPVAGLSSYSEGGLIYYLYQGVKLGIYPPLIFLGVGAMTDFGPLIANPKSFLLGAAAQAGIFLTYLGAALLGIAPNEAGAISIIGGADGPTAIFVTSRLAPELLGSIAIAAYSYMALVPIIQPPIMKLLTTKKERAIVMEQLRPVSKLEKVIFPIFVTLLSLCCSGCCSSGWYADAWQLMKRAALLKSVKTAQNELMNIVTIFLGVSVGATATALISFHRRLLELSHLD